MIVKIVPEGIVIGADRNVTHTKGSGRIEGERTIYQIEVGYGNRPKVCRWTNKKAVIGYVGAAKMGELFTDEWLNDFIGRNHDFEDLSSVAKTLKSEVENQRRKDDNGGNSQPQIIHLAGFQKKDSQWYPEVYYISNCWDFVDGQYADIRNYFGEYPDVFSLKYEGKSFDEIKADLASRAAKCEPRWFHQGKDLEIFNKFEQKLSEAFKELSDDGKVQTPSSLSDWENQVRFSLLTYGSYFQALKDPLSQAVGGGADALSLPWPS